MTPTKQSVYAGNCNLLVTVHVLNQPFCGNGLSIRFHGPYGDGLIVCHHNVCITWLSYEVFVESEQVCLVNGCHF